MTEYHGPSVLLRVFHKEKIRLHTTTNYKKTYRVDRGLQTTSSRSSGRDPRPEWLSRGWEWLEVRRWGPKTTGDTKCVYVRHRPGQFDSCDTAAKLFWRANKRRPPQVDRKFWGART